MATMLLHTRARDLNTRCCSKDVGAVAVCVIDNIDQREDELPGAFCGSPGSQAGARSLFVCDVGTCLDLSGVLRASGVWPSRLLGISTSDDTSGTFYFGVPRWFVVALASLRMSVQAGRWLVPCIMHTMLASCSDRVLPTVPLVLLC